MNEIDLKNSDKVEKNEEIIIGKYEALLPVAFIICFILLLLLIYALNNYCFSKLKIKEIYKRGSNSRQSKSSSNSQKSLINNRKTKRIDEPTSYQMPIFQNIAHQNQHQQQQMESFRTGFTSQFTNQHFNIYTNPIITGVGNFDNYLIKNTSSVAIDLDQFEPQRQQRSYNSNVLPKSPFSSDGGSCSTSTSTSSSASYSSFNRIKQHHQIQRVDTTETESESIIIIIIL
jgi:type III secretory pathway component EscV